MSQAISSNRIQRAFSNAAEKYENMTDFHKQIAWRLLSKVTALQNLKRILDVGMGTGFFTEKLAWFLDDPYVVGLDFSHDMLEKTKNKGCNIDLVQANANKMPFKDDSFDLVVSNLTYQWLDDLEAAFKEMHNVLSDEGKALVTMFGYNTFKEMFFSLEACVGLELQGKDLPIKRLHNHHQVMLALKKSGFKNINVKCEQKKVRFNDMFDLLRWSKSIGANALNKNMYVGKDLLKRANSYYSENFSDDISVYSTFEIIWIEAQK